jgi:hypothetical protein
MVKFFRTDQRRCHRFTAVQRWTVALKPFSSCERF